METITKLDIKVTRTDLTGRQRHGLIRTVFTLDSDEDISHITFADSVLDLVPYYVQEVIETLYYEGGILEDCQFEEDENAFYTWKITEVG